MEYYPSISLDLLEKALEFSKKYVTIDEQTTSIIMNSRKTFLYHQDKPYIKKTADVNNNRHFDVPMGSSDSAEICELTGLFLLSQIHQVFPLETCGLYRDDGLAVTKCPAHELDKLRQNLEKIFGDNGLKITLVSRIFAKKNNLPFEEATYALA